MSPRERERSPDYSNGWNGSTQDRHKYRRLAREQPGAYYANIIADFRAQLGNRGLDQEVGHHGPAVRKWWDMCFTMRFGRTRYEKHLEELEVLMLALDELAAGRWLEVADIVASRFRELVWGCESGMPHLATQFRSYQSCDHNMPPPAAVDEAVRMEQSEQKRHKAMAEIEKAASARRHGTAGR